MPTLTFSVFPFFATRSTNFKQTTHLTFYSLILNRVRNLDWLLLCLCRVIEGVMGLLSTLHCCQGLINFTPACGPH